MPDKTLCLLVDLRALRPGGEGGGIKPALMTMLRWLADQKATPLQFIYVANAETRTEVLALARGTDQVIVAAEATADLALRLDCDLVYCPFGVPDLACPGIPTITLVVDLLHRDFPPTLPEPDRIYREQKFAAALEVTDRFQVISDYTASRLTHYYAVPAGRIFRTYQPIHDRLTATVPAVAPRPAGPGRPFFLYPANFWIHKNHDALLVAYAQYRCVSGADAWALVLAGHGDQARLVELKKIVHALDIEADVSFTGFIPDAELAGYYRTAGALVFPSLHEGFGIPLLEAMAFGIPIVASNATVIPEITGDAALQVEARRPAELAEALGRVAGDPALRLALVARGRERLKFFSAETEFQQFREVIVETARQPARWRSAGYYPVDGLIEAQATFALPALSREITLVLVTRPLHVARILQISCGVDSLVERIIHAERPEKLSMTFQPRSRMLTLQVPDASSLSPADPRVHGVLLDMLHVQTTDGQWHDLLNPGTILPSSVAKDLFPGVELPPSPSKYLWQIETPLPDHLADGCLEIRGWCMLPDDDQPARLRLMVGGIDWQMAANLSRPDVQASYPMRKSDACGFSVRLRVPPGRHELVIEATGATGFPIQIIRHQVSVSPFAPIRRIALPDNSRLMAFQLMAGPSATPAPVNPERFRRSTSQPGRRPRFTVVTPSFQQAQFLEQTMRSVLEQTGVEGEYYVQDGGSTDGSPELMRKFATEWQEATRTEPGPPGSAYRERQAEISPPPPRLRLAAWESVRDNGQADAIARAFARSSGAPDDVMAWINSDDFYLPGTLAFVADYFARHPAVDVLYGNRILVDWKAREIGRWFLPRHDSTVLQLNDFVPQETLFWRRRVWDRVRGLDTSFQFAMDWDLLLRFQSAGARLVHVPYFLACFRVHASQKTSSSIHGIGQREIDRLRAAANGREIRPTELVNHPRLIHYLRRSALIEFLWSLGLRFEC